MKTFFLKNFIKSFLKRLFEPIFRLFSALFKKLTYLSCGKWMYFSWLINPPENFSHDIDLYYQWKKTANPMWIERGFYNLIAINRFRNPIVVDLCCGDGFFDYYFYSYCAQRVYAFDIDKKIINQAVRQNAKSNIIYEVTDVMKISEKMNDYAAEREGVTNVIMDAAILYFTIEELDILIPQIKKILVKTGGIFSGHTILESETPFFQHKISFASAEELENFLNGYFSFVKVVEVIYPDRDCVYFYATDVRDSFKGSLL